LTGIFSRCCGIKSDVRLSKSDTYAFYDLLKIKSYIGTNGDSYDRYLIRMLEMVESLNIITFISNKLLINSSYFFKYSNLTVNKYFSSALIDGTTSSMEDLISHFLF
jgi:NADH:ubiquinone oxidoreductase subunit D